MTTFNLNCGKIALNVRFPASSSNMGIASTPDMHRVILITRKIFKVTLCLMRASWLEHVRLYTTQSQGMRWGKVH